MRRLSTPLALAVLALSAPPQALAGAGDLRACAVTGIEGAAPRFEIDGFWYEGTEGDLPGAIARVETGPGTRLEVTCDDGLVVTVGPETVLDLGSIASPDGADGSLMIDLFVGILGIVAPGGDWQGLGARTPVAIASVRSTEWLVEHDAAAGGATAVFVREGRVEVANAAAGVVLAPGEGVTLGPEGVVNPVKAWGAERIARSTGALGFGWR